MATIQDIKNFFQQTDKTGNWKPYVDKFAETMISKANSGGQNALGDLWNEFRYSPFYHNENEIAYAKRKGYSVPDLQSGLYLFDFTKDGKFVPATKENLQGISDAMKGQSGYGELPGIYAKALTNYGDSLSKGSPGTTSGSKGDIMGSLEKTANPNATSYSPITNSESYGKKPIVDEPTGGRKFTTSQMTPFSGVLTEGKVYKDGQGNYFKYENGQWQITDQATYNSGKLKGTISPKEGNWIKSQAGGSGLPTEITSSQEWINASPENQQIATLLYNANEAIKSGNQALLQDTQDALQKALSIADPYFKQKLILAQDEIQRAAGTLTGDYQSTLKGYETKIKQLKEDLIFNKDQLTLSQQQEMSDQLRDYQNKLYGTQQQLAESGLAFSSPRSTAEANLLAEQQGIAQSTRQKYAQAFREQELNAQRQTDVLQQNITDLERKRKEGLTDIARQGEATVGTRYIPEIGVAPLGGITGSIDYEKQSAIPTLTQNYLDWANPLK